MATVQELITKWEPILKGHKTFKIGKTGQTCKDRFDEEHCKVFTKYAEMVYSTEPTSIDRYEIELIKHFKSYSNNKNEQEGGGEMTKSDRYIVYVVWS